MRVQIVSFHCVVKNKLGEFISSSFNHEVSTTPELVPQTARQNLSGFIEGLVGLRKGQKKKIFVEANEAYGFYEPALLVEMPRSKLPNNKSLKAGDEFVAILEMDDTPRVYRVVNTSPKTITLDGNHPLAGQDLVFDVEVTASRMEHEEVPLTALQTKRGLLC